jgi:hypothetical protein
MPHWGNVKDSAPRLFRYLISLCMAAPVNCPEELGV